MPRLVIPGFCGGSYTERSIDASSDRTVNLLPIIINPETRPPEMALIGTPGLTRAYALAGGTVRLLHTMTNGRVFAVAGSTLYELFEHGGFTVRGLVEAGTSRLSVDDNGIHALLVDGARGWVYTFATDTLQPITDPDFPGADFVAYIDGYFAFNIPGTGRFGLTGLLDPLTIDGLDFATAEERADRLLRLHVLNSELRLFGALTTEAWFNTGNLDFPFAQIQGTTMEHGICAPWSLGVLGNTYLWLAQNSQGLGKVITATAYQPTVVSTPCQEWIWATYPRREDAVAWTYTDAGHDFYVLTFPSGDATWVLNLTTGLWHEWASLRSDGTLGRHLAHGHCVAWGKHLVGDYRYGAVYHLDPHTYTDDGREILRLRRFPHTRTTRQRLFHHALEVHTQQGTLTDTVTPRHLRLRWSNDGGHSWSDEHWREVGPPGHYAQRARWHKLGQARDRVYELRQTAVGQTCWLNAYLDVEPGVH